VDVVSNRQRIRRHAANGARRGALVETIPATVVSDYYDQVVRCEGVSFDGEHIVLSRTAHGQLVAGWAVLAGIRGYFDPEQHAEFCRRCDEALHLIGDIAALAGDGDDQDAISQEPSP
jgi:hypothetical protein